MFLNNAKYVREISLGYVFHKTHDYQGFVN